MSNLGPAPMPFLGKPSQARVLQVMRLEEKIEQTDHVRASRASRLKELFDSDVWAKDLLPIMRELYDLYLNQVKEKKVDSDVLKVLDDLLQRLGGDFQVGVGAMERIAQRRLAAAEKLAANT